MPTRLQSSQPFSFVFPRAVGIRVLVPAVFAFALVVSIGCSEDAPTGPDETAPSAVNDLMARSLGNGGVRLVWTAPGDDGDAGRALRYDIRVSESMLTAASWDSAAALPSVPAPREVGRSDTVEVSELTRGKLYFALRAADESANWSEISNVVSIDLADTIAPDPILEFRLGETSLSSVTLEWLATGDDGPSGRASEYDLRLDDAPITEATWGSATRVRNAPAPAQSGGQEVFTVEGLEKNRGYFFALRAVDEGGNESPVSTSLEAGTVIVTPFEPAGMYHHPSAGDWSPDGTRIVFADAGDRGGGIGSVLIASAEGGDATVLRAIPGIEFGSPRWSPDGRQIALVFRTRAQPGVLWTIDADTGGDLVRLGEETGVRELAWSPDGTRVAFTIARPGGGMDIDIVPSVGGPAQRLDGGWPIWGIDWSPDGTTLAFGADRGDGYDIWLLPVTGGEPVRAIDATGPKTHPTWSPDGRQIACAWTRSAHETDLYRFDLAGGGYVRLTRQYNEDLCPIWSPDGSRLSFLAGTDIWTYDLSIVRLE